jgi:hypothetical protein
MKMMAQGFSLFLLWYNCTTTKLLKLQQYLERTGNGGLIFASQFRNNIKNTKYEAQRQLKFH